MNIFENLNRRNYHQNNKSTFGAPLRRHGRNYRFKISFSVLIPPLLINSLGRLAERERERERECVCVRERVRVGMGATYVLGTMTFP
jgi:hypothetical protein